MWKDLFGKIFLNEITSKSNRSSVKFACGVSMEAEAPQHRGVPGHRAAPPYGPGARPDGIGEHPDETIQRIEGRVLAIIDCIGDWREEIITSLPGELRIYTSTRPSTWRRPWLMEDRQYRLGVAAGSMGYYREPQLSGWLRP
jgi:hypothetical protein